MKFLVTGLLAGLSGVMNAYAIEYRQVLLPQSRIEFETRQMGVPVEGSFKRFAAEFAFDPTRPDAARVALDIDLSGIDAGSPDANAEVGGKPWFDFKAFPRARFVSRQVVKLAENRYELRGVLTLKGKSREMRVPVRYSPAGSTAVFDGSFVVKRLDFGIGTGLWADTETVADAVTVRVHLTAAAQQSPSK